MRWALLSLVLYDIFFCLFVVLKLWVLVTFLTSPMSTTAHDSVPCPPCKGLPGLCKILHTPWQSIVLLWMLFVWLIQGHYLVLTFISLPSCLSLWHKDQRSKDFTCSVYLFLYGCGCICTYMETNSRKWDITKHREWQKRQNQVRESRFSTTVFNNLEGSSEN